MLDRQQHDATLKRILRKIAENYELNNQLVFKGGTCLYLFYDLPRFSVDLDFNLKSENTFQHQLMTEILSRQLTIEDQYEKRFTWFWSCSYEKGRPQIKIEVSKRVFPDEIEVKSFYGLSINTLSRSSLFAHKLCAITDRDKLVNRDLFDAHFMLEKRFEINEDIIRLRTNKTLVEYLDYLLVFIEKNVNAKKILDGLGELVTQPQKEWVRNHLLDELIFQLKLLLEAEKAKSLS